MCDSTPDSNKRIRRFLCRKAIILTPCQNSANITDKQADMVSEYIREEL